VLKTRNLLLFLPLGFAACGNPPAAWPGVTPLHQGRLCERDPDGAPAAEPPEAERVDPALEAHFGEFDRCYAELRSRVGLVEGRVVAKLDVEPGGKVARTCAWETEIRDERFVSCVLDTSQKAQFASAAAPRTLRVPLYFRLDWETNKRISGNDERWFW
jgi:hypothetical protein